MSAPKRYSWHEFILYPDNRYHLDLLNFLKRTAQIMYIKHDPDELHPRHGLSLEAPKDDIEAEEDEAPFQSKPHYHVALYLPFASTQTAVLKKFNYHAYFYEKPDGTLTSFPNGNNKVIKPIITKRLCRPIKNISAYALYMLHGDFKSEMLGKKKYDISQVQLSENAPPNMFRKYLAEGTEKCDSGYYAQIAFTLAINAEDSDQFFIECMTYPDENFQKWFLKNHNFVKSFIIHGRYDRNNITEYVAELTQIIKEDKKRSENEWIQIL